MVTGRIYFGGGKLGYMVLLIWLFLTGSTEALEFGQKKLTPFGKVSKYVEKLEDFMALLAYEEPEKSPMFHLLAPEYRQNVADSLNRAILAHANLPAYSSLERVIQQSTVVRQYLQQEVDKAFLDK
uniref:CRA domain-containing protein n=1 Tax=Aegilops tauschii subsp. strangulata TaxID=200361 RepID=A0A453FNE5_AEGTS